MTVIYKFVIESEKDFKENNVTRKRDFEFLLSKIEDTKVIHEFLHSTFKATDFIETTANKVKYDRTDSISNSELYSSSNCLRWLIGDFDLISFQIPKEEGRYVAYYVQEVVCDSLLINDEL